MNSNTILVTGGAGLIGSHLCRRLLKEGHRVICIDNLITGKKEAIRDLLINPAFQFINRDIVIPCSLRVDQIYHLASAASPPTYQNYPADTIRTAVLGTFNMLELARQNNAVMLLASSGSVYGDLTPQTLPEEYRGNVDTSGSRACNEEGKRAAEAACLAYRNQYRTEIRIARIFNTYGPGVDVLDGRAIPAFIRNALQEKDLVIYGNGMQTRCFCYVDDMVDGLMRLMNSSSLRRSEPINLGSDKPISIRTLAEQIISLTGSHSRIVSLMPDKPILRHRTPDLQRARRILDWQATTSIEDGLRQTIEYLTAQIQDIRHCQPAHSWVEMD